MKNDIFVNVYWALCNLWSEVMDWSLGVKPWSGVLSGFWSGMESDLEFYHPSRTGFYD